MSGLEKFGMFVEFLPGRQGLVHVSELDLTRSSDASAFSVGDIVDVKLLEVKPISPPSTILDLCAAPPPFLYLFCPPSCA